MSKSLAFGLVVLLGLLVGGCEGSPAERRMAAALAKMKTQVVPGERPLEGMVLADIRARKRAFNQAETKAFAKLRSRADWEAFRDKRLAALKRALGPGAFDTAGAGKVVHHVTGTLGGPGFRVEKLVIEPRPGLPVTANLYLPDPLPKRRVPGILIISSHHNPKGQGELQDMGMTWARSGAIVLVPDNLGHGERKQQRFGKREDYRWRYHLGNQLYTVGETLMGWMVADSRRALDLLCSLKQVDPKRVILMGAVAGGGDPSAVLAVFDPRVTCSIPFNFGSAIAPKPTDEDPKPIPDFMRWADWESTRALLGNGPGGYVPWMIVACTAPRWTIFAKEFDWSPQRDQGFGRIARVFELYGARDKLGSMHGYGRGSMSSREASHCNNVGPHHRKQIYPILRKWLKMPVPTEYRSRVRREDLYCLTDELREKLKVRPMHEICAEIAARKVAAARAAIAAAAPGERKAWLRKQWSDRLGRVEAGGAAKVTQTRAADTPDMTAEKLTLVLDRITVPGVLLRPKGLPAGAKPPVVVGVTEEGKSVFLAKRRREIAGLLSRGVAVCLIDVRGTGESRPRTHRGYYSRLVHRACEELMLGSTMLGARLCDLRATLAYLRTRPDLDGRRVGVWGEAFAGTNPAGFADPPMNTDHPAAEARPAGALLALLAALYDDDVRAVVARGGLVSFASLLDGPAGHVALDSIVPDVLAAGDVAELAGALAGRPVRLEAFVTGRNISAKAGRLKKDLAPARAAYAAAPGALSISPAESSDVAAFLAEALKPPAE